MALIRELDIRARAQRRALAEGRSVADVLSYTARQRLSHYDIFLSQTIRDAELVLGIYDLLTEKGYTVFCDWIEAPEFDRCEVTPANAAFIRQMMGLSDTLLFLDTDRADQSLWMCWELGWFDGSKGRVGILPVLPDSQQHYRSREFLGLYPYLEIDDSGQLKVVRPVVTGPTGVTIIEAPNSRSFDVWRFDSRDSMVPRAWGEWRNGL